MKKNKKFGRKRHLSNAGRHRHNENTIYSVDVNKEYVVEEVPQAGLLPCLGIYPKSRVRKSYRYKMGGPVLLQVGNREVAVGKDIADQILVKEVE